MNDRNYLITMALMGFFLIISLFYLSMTTDAFSSRNSTSREDFILPVFEAIPEQTVDCHICHMRPENLTGHINGGNYCASCHGTDLHELHKKGLECSRCHGSSAARPGKLEGHTAVCDTCHGYPDPLAPSFGNLITIHTTRGRTCDICHIQDIQSLHKIEAEKAKYTVFTN